MTSEREPEAFQQPGSMGEQTGEGTEHAREATAATEPFDREPSSMASTSVGAILVPRAAAGGGEGVAARRPGSARERPGTAVRAPGDQPAGPGQPPNHGDRPNEPGTPVEHVATAPQLRRFIKSRAYVPMHELRRRFAINGDDDEVTALEIDRQRVYVGLPDREGRLLGDLLRAGDIGAELSVDPTAPIVVGVYPMRPIPRT